MKNICIIADTPYQVLNALCLGAMVNEKSFVDLYIDKKFSGYDGIILRLKKCGVFKNVYSFSDDRYLEKLNNTYKNSIIKNVKNAQMLKNSVGILLTCLEDNKQVTSIPNYDKIFCPSSTSFNLAMIFHNPKSEVNLYDEGTASYGLINILADPFYKSKCRELFYKFMGVNVNSINVSKLYSNNPAMCKNTTAKEVVQLPNLLFQSNNFESIVKYVFQYTEDNAYCNASMVLLTQPMEKLAADSRIINESIYESLLCYRDCLIVRKHPMDETNTPSVFTADKVNNMWELLCKDVIDDHYVLIGPCSTAQFTPKALYNKEPWIIFTHRLYTIDYSYFKENFTNISELLKESYSNKNKILEPSSINELIECLNRIQAAKGE